MLMCSSAARAPPLVQVHVSSSTSDVAVWEQHKKSALLDAAKTAYL